MFDGYILTDNSVRNILADDTLTTNADSTSIGFQMRTRIPYYRGVPLSMVHDVVVEVDGKRVDPSSIRFSADAGAHWFTLEEMWTVASMRWEYADEAFVRVMRPGGLSSGTHDIKLEVAIRVAYIPVPFGGTMTRTITIS